MTIKHQSQAQDFERMISTEEFAALNLVKPHTVRARLCTTGSYYGVVPKKLRNGFLVWPAKRVA